MPYFDENKKRILKKLKKRFFLDKIAIEKQKK